MALTDADVFKLYEAAFREYLENPTALKSDLRDVALYRGDGTGLTPEQRLADHAALAGLAAFSDPGVGSADPLTLESVRELAAAILGSLQGIDTSLTPLTDAEREARAAIVANDMIAGFDAEIAANAAAAAYLPSTPEERDGFTAAIDFAMANLSQARDTLVDIGNGDASPGTIALAVNLVVRSVASVVGMLPVPGPVKLVANTVVFATYLVRGLIDVATGKAGPDQLSAIAANALVLFKSWGTSDFIAQALGPVALSMGQAMQASENGTWDYSFTGLNRALIEGNVHDAGGSLPEWWYAATVGDDGGSSAERQTTAKERAVVIATTLDNALAGVKTQLDAKFAGIGNYYQEATLNLWAEDGPTQYVFGSTRSTYGSVSSILFGNIYNPNDYVSHVSGAFSTHASLQHTGGVWVLEHSGWLTQTGSQADYVFMPVGRAISTLGGNDTVVISQQPDGRPGVGDYSALTAAQIDGGAGEDVLDLSG